METETHITSIEPHLNIAGNLGIFFPAELDILKMVLEDYQRQKDGYIVFEEYRDGQLAGYIIFGRIPITVYGWDIYWLVVDKNFQGIGIGSALLKRVERHIVQNHGSGTLRVETSTRKEYAHARNLYAKAGFLEAGKIADYYDQGDDLIIFYKRLTAEGTMER